ncbi:MAG: 1-phosphofructokinase family hexose kinase [Clostridia bacterium]|nr:1-phosphofructokinase family hexose kinase [Clostridia bacterium]
MREKVAGLSLSPAMDRTIYVDDFCLNEVNRAREATAIPGSKGVNVAKCLAASGLESICFGFIGGPDRAVFISQLNKYGVRSDFLPVDYPIRNNIKIVDLRNSTYTDVNLEAGTPTEAQLQSLVEKTAQIAQECAYVALSGHVSKSMPQDLYKTLCGVIHENGAKVAVDCSGVPLLSAIEACPDVIKPNIKELCDSFDVHLVNRYETIECAKRIRERGVKNVLVSAGPEGAVAACEDGAYVIQVPSIPVYNTVGAGDAFLSGFIYGQTKGMDIENSLRHAASFSQAVVKNHASDMLDFDALTASLDEIEVQKVD